MEILGRRPMLQVAATTIAAGLLAASCGSPRQPPTPALPEPTVTTDPVIKAKEALKKTFTEYGYDEATRFTLDQTGITFIVYSDDPAGIQTNPQAFTALFESIPSYANQVGVSPLANAINYPQEIQNSFDLAQNKKYSGTEIYLMIPSSQRTCISGDQIAAMIPPGADTNTYCTALGQTVTVQPITGNTPVQPSIFFMTTQAGADDDRQITLFPSSNNPIHGLSPQDAQTSTLFHEMIHLLLRLNLLPQSPGEEQYAQDVERKRLEDIIDHPEKQTTPIIHLDPISSLSLELVKLFDWRKRGRTPVTA